MPEQDEQLSIQFLRQYELPQGHGPLDGGGHLVAFDRRFLKEHADPAEWDDRAVDQWGRPTDIAPGVTLAVRIVVPYAAVSIPIDPKDVPDVAWATRAADGLAREADVVLTSSGVRTSSWPGHRSMNTELLGRFDTDNGDTVWVVTRVIAMPSLSKLFAKRERYFGGHSREDVKGATGLRAILFGNEKDGSRVLYEVVSEPAALEPSVL